MGAAESAPESNDKPTLAAELMRVKAQKEAGVISEEQYEVCRLSFARWSTPRFTREHAYPRSHDIASGS
jgi:hypothetical protein